ncbi:hypothetical protein CAPTEDRAFT_205144 [Capitella teleta]|uniref:Uncharacterized protein n=1 Tax=Capitella teleta TaxID=283909 RepID=R7TT95_CAPTE|nr:hypothetical protein CAPTEDRAFT_205144 [Capitella teleta]|eukprot:ELT96812.1 hypothetical protein CAPTEDRAFT_205144 [Capitella teleta]
MYKVGLVRLGILQTILAAACLPEGGALMALNRNAAWSGIGLWVGVPVSFGSACAALAVFASAFLLISCIINLAGVSSDVGRIYPSYESKNLTPLYVCNILLFIIGSLQLPTAVLATMHYLGISCSCCKDHMSGVFTIEHEDPQDFAWDPYDTPQRNPAPNERI